LCDSLWNFRTNFINSEQFLANPKNEQFKKTISAIMPLYYSDVNKPIVFDKCFDWVLPSNLELAYKYVNPLPKVIITVRSIPEILTSFILLCRRANNFLAFDGKHRDLTPFYMHEKLTQEEQVCEMLMRPGGIIDRILFGIKESSIYFKDNIHFVEYDNLVENTQEEMDKIYDFFYMDRYEHDLDNIQVLEKENDDMYGLPTMHDVRIKVGKDINTLKPEEVLSERILKKYSGMEFWRK
jgi:hypothetical protein